MNTAIKILVVEDGRSEREALVRMLRTERWNVLAAKDPEEALKFIDEPIHLVISDLRMGERSGIDLLSDWQERRKGTPFLIMTAYGDVETAVTAMKLGAVDFLTKPVDPDQLLTLVRQCLKPHLPAHKAGADAATDDFFSRIIGESPDIKHVCDLTRRAAQTESTVLVLGESGTGKELVAEAIHHNSPRRKGPFVLVNMAAIPETLVESELFGHVRGAFTGASANREGRFEAAHGGTIFIDEIGDFPLALQAKLLRALENRTVTPLGSNYDKLVDVRVVAATSRDLAGMTAVGKFREDLYYRLNVVAIHLPPLRERRGDIPLLARHFVDQISRINLKPPVEIEPALMHALQDSFSWPGNVRQLRNCLESMVVMSNGTPLTIADLPKNLAFEPGGKPVPTAEGKSDDDTSLEALKRTAIMRALSQFHGNRTHAAEHLGISVRTLQRKLKDWGLPVHDEPGAGSGS